MYTALGHKFIQIKGFKSYCYVFVSLNIKILIRENKCHEKTGS